MIIEIVALSVKDNSIEAFQAALPEALGIIRYADGYIAHHLDHTEDDPCRYTLTIQWKGKYEAIDRFRESGRMEELRYVLYGYCSEMPKSHYYCDAELDFLVEQLNLSNHDSVGQQNVVSMSCN